MFGSNPFGQSSSSPFGTQATFGQPANNPFAPKPFGSPTNSFGAQTGSSLFGGTSTGVFGQPSTPGFGASSPSPFGSSTPQFGSSTPAFGSSTPAFGSSTPSFGASSSLFGTSSTPAFGASSTPAFGVSSSPAFGASSTPAFGASSTPAFGASSTPAFGASSSPAFGSGSLFGQKTAFGGFGSSPSQSSPSGSSFQQTQPAFGSNAFGSTPFGTPTQPSFGSSSTPAFGVGNAQPFGSTSTTPFGSSSTSLFGTTGSFGVQSSPAFGSTASTGVTSSAPFGSSSTPAFGATSSPFGQPSASAFGASSSPSFNFGSSPAFGQSGSTFGSTPLGTNPSPFGVQSSTSFGGFGQSNFGSQAGGSRIAPYTSTPEEGTSGTQASGKLESISAMPVYKDKSHEELRWEDYQRGDKGGPNPAVQSTGSAFPTQTQGNLFSSMSTFGQSTASSVFSAAPTNPFAAKSPFSSSSSTSLFSSPFNSTTTNPFQSSPSTTNLFAPSTGSNLFQSNTMPAFGSSGFSSPMTSTNLTLGNTQSSGLFQSSGSFMQTPSLFGQPSTGSSLFGNSSFGNPSTGFSTFSGSAPSFTQTATQAFGQTTPGFSNLFSGSTQTQSSFSFPNINQTQQVSPSVFGSVPSIFNQNTTPQSTVGQFNMVMQPAVVSNPFGTLPAVPQVYFGQGGSTPSVQYGISSLPVAEKPSPVRSVPLLVPKHISHRRIRLPPRRYNAKADDPKVPFFVDDEVPSTPKADAFFVPRENPRSLIISPIEQWPSRASSSKEVVRDISNLDKQNGKAPEVPLSSDQHMVGTSSFLSNKEVNGSGSPPTKPVSAANGIGSSRTNKESQENLVHQNGTEVERMMPTLRHADYYTEPRLEELAAKERAEPGFCHRVKDFVVGRRGYGSIKFIGETDVRALALDSIIEFNFREVIVYKEDSEKPPVGQGLNKPAEVTLLNIKCVNKKTGEQYSEGPMVEKYKEMLRRKAEEQGAEFLSFDAAKGEWKFVVKHFSSYGIGEEQAFLLSLLS